MLPILYVQPGGEPFCNFMLALTNHALLSTLQDKETIKSELQNLSIEEYTRYRGECYAEYEGA